MKTRDILEETFTALTANKVRSGLTVLGIVIGISSVMIMTSIGQGAQASISESIQSIGANLIFVQPGTQRGPGSPVSGGRGTAKSITLEDYDAIVTTITPVKGVAPEVTGRYQVTAKGTNTNTQVVGTVPIYTEVRNVQVTEGTFLTDSQVKSGARVAVIGPTTKTDLFADNDAIGQHIRIKQVDFKIIGVTVAKGGSGFSNPDDMIYIPMSAAQRYLSGDSYISNISIAAESSEIASQVQADVTALLTERHHIKDGAPADFSTMNQADMLATMSSITQTFTVLLSAIAGISLIVGGIGIMNMMLTTVTERTREIGLRKAIGARAKDISRQFLAESVMLTLAGGIMGIALGWLVSFAVTYSGLLQTKISVSSIVLACGVSAAIGIVFGYYPALRAARLNPIDALRYE
ncbi:MAG: ABC transporter permease [Minisyncoccia bacterium]